MSKIKLTKEVYESPFWKHVRETAERLERDRPKPDYPNLDKCELLMKQAYDKYGPPRSLDYFPGDFKWGPSWRAWWTSHHMHTKDMPKASSGSLCFHASTLAEAIEKILNAEETHIVREGECCEGCPGYSNDGY